VLVPVRPGAEARHGRGHGREHVPVGHHQERGLRLVPAGLQHVHVRAAQAVRGEGQGGPSGPRRLPVGYLRLLGPPIGAPAHRAPAPRRGPSAALADDAVGGLCGALRRHLGRRAAHDIVRRPPREAEQRLSAW